ncbi:MAG: arginase family protein [Gemmatimonadaceae bacterium]
MNIQLLAVPYDSGNRGVRMGAGPERLLQAGIQGALSEAGHSVKARIAELPEGAWHAEIQSSFELMRMLADAVRSAQSEGSLPVVLAGNCNTAVGTLTGLGEGVGVAWFDAHGDFNTPETTTTGFLDGTAVAIITGRCWRQLAGTVGFAPLPDERVCLVGTRELDPLEEALLESSNVEIVKPPQLRSGLPRALRAVGEHVERIYVHLDLDVLDASVAAANTYSVGGGLSVEDVEYALALIGKEFRIAAITLSAYDPAVDSDGRAARAAIRLVCSAAAAANRA